MFKIILFHSLVSLTGCELIFRPIEIVCMEVERASTDKKDVSNDFDRGHLVGKQYELLADIYLKQDKASNELVLDRNYFITEGEINIKKYSIFEVIPKGTRFKVCQVQVKTSFGNESNAQYIFANIINEKGSIEPRTNSKGVISLLNVTYLFKNVFQEPNMNWVFLPMPGFIKELQEYDIVTE